MSRKKQEVKLEDNQILKDRKLTKILNELSDCGIEIFMSITRDNDFWYGPSLRFIKENEKIKVPIKVEWDKTLGIWCMKFYFFYDVSNSLEKLGALLAYMNKNHSF